MPLPDDLRAALAQFDALLPLSEGWTTANHDRRRAIMDAARPAQEAFAAAMAKLGLAPRAAGAKNADGSVMGVGDRPILPAPALTAVQRAVLTEIVDRSDAIGGGSYPVPSTAHARRQWLAGEGMFAPRGEQSTLFEELRALAQQDESALEAHLAAIPAITRVPLLAELDLLGNDISAFSVITELLEKSLTEIGPELGNWGAAFADRELTRRALPRDDEATNQGYLRGFAAFVALVTAGIPLEARHDALLLVAVDRPAAYQQAWLDAIPEGRREAAILAALSRINMSNARVARAAELLAKYPYVSLAEYVFDRIKDSFRPESVKAAIAAASEAHPTIKAALAARKKANLAAKLTMISREPLAAFLPLAPIGRAQLEQASLLYNGRTATADEILTGVETSTSDTILPESIEVLHLKGKTSAYDAWLYNGDSGAIFRAGTTEVVAEIVQRTVEASDKSLITPIHEVLRTRPKKAKKGE